MAEHPLLRRISRESGGEGGGGTVVQVNSHVDYPYFRGASIGVEGLEVDGARGAGGVGFGFSVEVEVRKAEAEREGNGIEMPRLDRAQREGEGHTEHHSYKREKAFGKTYHVDHPIEAQLCKTEGDGSSFLSSRNVSVESENCTPVPASLTLAMVTPVPDNDVLLCEGYLRKIRGFGQVRLRWFRLTELYLAYYSHDGGPFIAFTARHNILDIQPISQCRFQIITQTSFGTTNHCKMLLEAANANVR